MSSLKDSHLSLRKTSTWKQTCHAIIVLRPKDRLLSRFDAIHCHLQANPLQCMHLWMCSALCHPLSTNAHRMWHLWRSSTTSANNNIHPMLGVHPIDIYKCRPSNFENMTFYEYFQNYRLNKMINPSLNNMEKDNLSFYNLQKWKFGKILKFSSCSQ
jgi:hypothetical protein